MNVAIFTPVVAVLPLLPSRCKGGIPFAFGRRLRNVCAASASASQKRSTLFSIGVFPFAFGTRLTPLKRN